MSHEIQSRRERFYKRFTLDSSNIAQDADDWKGDKASAFKLEFPTTLTTIVIVNDNDDRVIEYSFNGRDLDGELYCDDGPFSQDCTKEGYLYFRLPEGTELEEDEKVQVRVWAWRGGVGR